MDNFHDSSNFVFGEVPVAAQVNTPRATPDKIVGIAKEIWAAITKSNVGAMDDNGNDALLERLQKEYRDFQQSFPLVLRWMVQMRKFNEKAFHKYLIKHASAKLNSREAFLELQAEYLVLLYREETRHPDEAFVKKYRQEILDSLLKEDKEFLKMHEEAEKEIKKTEQDVTADRRRAIYEYLLKRKVAQEQAEGP